MPSGIEQMETVTGRDRGKSQSAKTFSPSADSFETCLREILLTGPVGERRESRRTRMKSLARLLSELAKDDSRETDSFAMRPANANAAI